MDSQCIASQIPRPCAFSREDLLVIIRKHWNADPAMEPRYWRQMLDLFFIRGWGKDGSSHQFQYDGLFDNMLFFVRLEEEVSVRPTTECMCRKRTGPDNHLDMDLYG